MIVRLFLMAMIVINLISCTWVTRDYIYVPVKNEKWSYQYTKGFQKSVKDVPIPDQGMHVYKTEDFEFELSAGFTVVMTSGPWLLPVIPSSMFSNPDLVLKGVLYSKHKAIVFDFSSLEIAVKLKSGIHVSSFELYDSEDNLISSNFIEIPENSQFEFTLKIGMNGKDVKGMSIKGIQYFNEYREIPELIIIKRRGSYNVDELTI